MATQATVGILEHLEQDSTLRELCQPLVIYHLQETQQATHILSHQQATCMFGMAQLGLTQAQL